MNISRCHSNLLSEFFRFHDLLGIYINVSSASSIGRQVFHTSDATHIHLPLEGLDLRLYSSIDAIENCLENCNASVLSALMDFDSCAVRCPCAQHCRFGCGCTISHHPALLPLWIRGFSLAQLPTGNRRSSSPVEKGSWFMILSFFIYEYLALYVCYEISLLSMAI